MRVRRYRAFGVIVAAAAFGLASLPSVGAAAFAQETTTAAPYVSFIYAHTGQLVHPDCTPDPQSVSLGTITQAFAARGMAPTGTLVSSWVGRCIAGLTLQPVPKYITIPSWSVIQAMGAKNWGFVPHSRTYADVTKLTASQQSSEICGSKADLISHGFKGTASMFAYPNNFSNPQAQTVVRGCGYLAGRKYTPGVNTLSTLNASRYVGTHSVNGGWCNNPALGCYNFQGPLVAYRYENIPALQTEVSSVHAGQWVAIQFYRAITGSGPDGDCTSPDWHDHWTVGTEYLCWNDMLSVLNAVPAGTRVVHPMAAEHGLGLTTWP
jgi:Polysaccharide deacetylase